MLLRFAIDDAVDAIPVHLVNGMWGLLAVGFLASPSRLDVVYPSRHEDYVGLFYTFASNHPNARLLGSQMVGLLFILGWVMVIMLPFFVWLDWKGLFRSDPLEEIVGLDTSYHGGLALLKDGDVNPEYISAFKRQKAEKRNSTGRRSGSSHSMNAIPDRKSSLIDSSTHRYVVDTVGEGVNELNASSDDQNETSLQR
jgi:ammonium transporter, Amt family